MADAVVIGAGPNGLTAANLLADEGWDVVVLEAQSTPGGAVRSAELTRPGCIHDVFSAFYPLAAASPHLSALELERHGLRWRHAPLVLSHPLPDGRCASLSRDLSETAASLDEFAPGDGRAWLELSELWERVEPGLLDTLFSPFPPVRGAGRLASTLGRHELMRFLRHVALPVRRMGEEWFAGEGGPLLLAGNALHADVTPESSVSGALGWLLVSLGQRYGYPVPEGGAQMLTQALVNRLESRGGRVICGERVDRVVIRDGRALGVRTASGERFRARRAVLADTLATTLYIDLIGEEHLPPRVVDDVRRMELDSGTFKVDWLLRGPIPWVNDEARRAGTVHIGASMTEFTTSSSHVAAGVLPEHPALVLGQMNVADPTRSPAPTHTVWAYTKIPQRVVGDAAGNITGEWNPGEVDAFVRRMEAEMERHAPGFGDLIEARHVLAPADFESRDENLVGGAVNGGTAKLHQQLVFRPTPGLGRTETPIRGLYLASASAHPGGGVHGGPGANAARAALLGPIRRRVAFAAVNAVR